MGFKATSQASENKDPHCWWYFKTPGLQQSEPCSFSYLEVDFERDV